MKTFTSFHPQRERGQSLVEFSLMMVLLLFLLQGVMDLGRAYYTYLAVKDAAAEGAYFAAAYPECATATSKPGCGNPNNVTYRITNSAPTGGLISWNNATITTITGTISEGAPITVNVSYTYSLISPLLGTIAGGQDIRLGATSVSTIIRVPNCNADTNNDGFITVTIDGTTCK